MHESLEGASAPGIQRVRPSATTLATAALAAAGAVAASIALVVGRADVALVAVAVALIPYLATIGVRRPDLLIGLFVLAQPLEAFEVPTPAATISVGNVLLAVLLITNARPIWHMLRASRTAQVAAGLLLGWLVLYPLRALHDPPGEVLRTTVTMGSFVLVAVAGFAVSPRRRALRSIALGAFGALMVLAVAGILVNLGLLPMTERYGGPRTLFGIESPFSRTYGLNVPFDAVTLLIPLCVPFLANAALDRREPGVARTSAAAAVGLVGLASLLVFQSRGMLLEIALTLALVLLLVVRPRYRPGLIALLGVGIVVLAVRLVNADPISSGLRSGVDSYAVQAVLSDPARFVIGVPERDLYAEGAATVGLQDFAPADSVVHNFFLSTLVGGGFAPFACILAVHALGTWAPFKRWRVAPSSGSRTMLVAVVVALLGLSIEPARAGIVGSWLLLGLAIGRGTGDPHRSPQPGDPTRIARAPVADAQGQGT